MWQTVYIINTLRADVASKIILKNYNEQKKKKNATSPKNI